jgi:hypothetical protein
MDSVSTRAVWAVLKWQALVILALRDAKLAKDKTCAQFVQVKCKCWVVFAHKNVLWGIWSSKTNAI